MKIIALIAVMTMLCGVMTGCKKEETPVQTPEIQQNDYRGGIKRTKELQEKVLDKVDFMKQNNDNIRSSVPNSFWSDEDYQDFVLNFFANPIIDDTQWFNEEEQPWDVTKNQFTSVDNSFTQLNDDGTYSPKYDMSVIRNEKDDYSITGIERNLSFLCFDEGTYRKNFETDEEYRILYDCDKDRCKTYITATIDDAPHLITTGLFEYIRLDDNTFAVQTDTERLFVSLAPSDDTSLEERELTEFYYSKLSPDGVRSEFVPYYPLAEVIDGVEIPENVEKNQRMKEFSFMNEDGDLTNSYGVNDSIFIKDNINGEITREWTFEDHCLQQALSYKDGVFVVTTYNKLTDGYERFTYTLEGANDKTVTELESLVEIKDLVSPPEQIPEPTEPTTEDTTEDTTDEAGTEDTTEDTTESTSEESKESTLSESDRGMVEQFLEEYLKDKNNE